MADVPSLQKDALMGKLVGSGHPGDALICLRDVTAYLAATFEWSQMSATLTMSEQEAAGLGYVLTLIEKGLQEVYDAI
ncbi:MAG: hypothetical protein RBT47_07550 [Anaerolineae bacterium]|jgi:hypothetical protein|nr:hypothetical protein [Anaerolineae bacterium]